jgi:hypothetical protein
MGACWNVAGNGGGYEDAARRSQEHWLAVRGYLDARRHDLAAAAQHLYPPSWRVAGTPLLARPEWRPATPVPLDEVRLDWLPDAPRPEIDAPLGSPEVLPLRGDGSRFGSYAAALEALRRPGLFADRTCYRLVDAEATPEGAKLGFGPGHYFQVIDTCEAVAHEYAAAVMASGGQAPPAMAALPVRSLIGDPTDLARRPVMAAIAALVLRADRASAAAAMILHWRDPARVASGGGMYQVAPVGLFQPSHDAGWNRANDFSLWRCFIRELAEELLGAGEDYQSDAAPIDYGRWPLAARLASARRSGALRMYWLGLGCDPLTLATDMLSVAVFDARLFDATFTGLVRANAEGRIVAPGGPGGAVGVPFTEKTIERFAVREPMQPAGAALLRLAWAHRETLLSA